MMTLNRGYQDTRYNYHSIDNKEPWTHIRLNIYPDGGIARLRLYGEAHPNWKDVSPDKVRTHTRKADSFAALHNKTPGLEYFIVYKT